MKPIILDRMNSTVVLFGLLSIRSHICSGRDWVFMMPSCGWELSLLPVLSHFYGYYVQLGCLGVTIMWKSKKCIEDMP